MLKKLRFRMPRRVWTPAIVALVALALVCGGILAAVNFTYHGTVNVVPEGGSGGTGGVSYDFAVYQDENRTVMDDTFWELGDVLRGGSVTKTVYLEKLGTASTVNVDVTLSGVLPVDAVSLSAPSSTVVLAGAGLVPVDVTIDVAPDAEWTLSQFNINFDLVS